MIPLLLVGFGSMAAGIATAAERTPAARAARARMQAPPTSPEFPIAVTLTGYYPYTAKTAAEKRMEGPPVDHVGRPIHTLQQHIADPVAHPYVSLAGDGKLFAYGQRVIIPALGTPSVAWQQRAGSHYYIGRVVDTGCHFYDDPTATKQCGRLGAVKRWRYPGAEPIDVAVQDARHGFGALLAAMAVVRGDVLDPKTGRRVFTASV